MCGPYAQFYVFYKSTHRVSHSPLSREALRQFHPSYKIMDRHHTSLGASMAHHGPHKDFIYACWITPLSHLFSPSLLFSATAHALIVDDRLPIQGPCVLTTFSFTEDWSDCCVASTPFSLPLNPTTLHTTSFPLPPIIYLLCAGVWSASLSLIL